MESVQNDATDRILDMIRIGLEKGLIDRDIILRNFGTKPKGRSAPPLPEFTFEGSGITVRIRRFSPFTLDAISRKTRQIKPPPEPPRAMRNYGTKEDPEYRMEENLADPEYKKALAEYETEVGESGGRAIIDKIINHAVVLDDIDLDEVSEMRSFFVDLGLPQEEIDEMSDHSIYVKHICIKTPDDLTRLQRFVIGESMPTEELVKAHEENFRGDIQGQAHTPVSDTIVRDEVQHIPEHPFSSAMVGISS